MSVSGPTTSNRRPSAAPAPRPRAWAWAVCCLLVTVAARPALADPAAADALVPPELVHYERAVYPEALRDKALRGTVVLELDVGQDGQVRKVAVVESAGPDFDAAAAAAGALLRFDPARYKGKSTAVRIRFRYRFEMEVAAARRERAAGLGRYRRRAEVRAPEGFSSLRGVVVEMGTRRPLAAALVLVPQLNLEVLTDADGVFAFGPLPKGVYGVQAQAAGHKAARTRVRIRDGHSVTVTMRAERDSYTLYRATALAPPEPGEMTRRELTVEEIQRIPGVYGDAFKVVQNLPGVARQPGLGGQIIVRGSAPEDTQVMVEGVGIPLLYHFGGLYSVINTDILQGIDFLPGGYPVRYGRGNGGLLQARLKLPKRDEKWTGYLETNVFHTGALVSGPLQPQTTLTVAGRRSYIDAVLATVVPDGVLPFTLAPRYYDYQLKLDHRFNDRANGTLLLLGADDGVKLIIDRPPAGFAEAAGGLEASTLFHGAIGLLRLSGDGWHAKTTFGAVWTRVNFDVGGALRVDITNLDWTLRQDFTLGEGPVALRAGLDLRYSPMSIDVLLPQVGAEEGKGEQAQQARRQFQHEGRFIAPSAWVDAVFKLHPRLEVVPGIRLDWYRGEPNGESATPRLVGRYKLDDQVTLKASLGQTSQPAAFNETIERFGNPKLQPERGFESSLGVELALLDRFEIDLQAFYKRLWDQVVPEEELIPRDIYVNQGTGRVLGLELLARHKPVGRFFGWIAYTLMRAEQTEHPGETPHLMPWDQTHILTAVASYKLPYNFEISARFRVVSGNPYTDMATAVYDAENDNWDRVRSDCVLCARMPTFHQLDLRVDKKWVFDAWMLNAYIDLQNAYNRGNVEGWNYSYDAMRREPQTGLPIIPSLGIKAEF